MSRTVIQQERQTKDYGRQIRRLRYSQNRKRYATQYKRGLSKAYKPSVQHALGFSRSQYVRLRYCQSIQLAPSATSNAYIIYSANSIFSPNVGASAGVSQSTIHQPLGRDQWAAIYNHYIVLGSKITFMCTPTNSTAPASAGGIVSLLLTDTASAITTPTTVLESGRASYLQITPNSTGDSTILRKTYSTAKFFKVSNPEDSIDNYGAAVGANPDEQAYFIGQFFCNDLSSSTSAGPLIWVTIDYFCLLTGPQDLTQS